MKPPRIVSAEALDDRTLVVKFTDREIRKYDISKLLDNPMFSLLRNPKFFRNFQVEPGGYGLVWNEDIDISEYELWQYGICVTEEDVACHPQVTHH